MNLKQILYQTNNKKNLPSFDIELILAYVSKKTREYILAHPDLELNKLQIKNYELLIKKRQSGIPLAYITGEKEFYGFNFKVNKNVLVPRPETELMVEEAIKLFKNVPSPSQGEGQGEVGGQQINNFSIIDVGTGSGCIIISLVKLITNYLSSVALAKVDKLQITNYKLFGTDISSPALKIAEQNAKLNKVDDKIKFVHGNLLESILKRKKSEIRNCLSPRVGKFVITANLPYLTPSQIKNSPSIKHEPKLSLTAGVDGLKYYRQLFKQTMILLNKTAAESSRRDSAGAKAESATVYLLCEIDPSQKNTIKQLIKKELPGATFEIKKDLKGHSRLVIISI